MATLQLQSLTKRYGDFLAIPGIDLDIADGEFLVLVGPSGCGKSTLLRMVAGLEEVSAGDIVLDGAVMTHSAPRDRDVAMVFQDYALYPHMSIEDNISFGLRMRGANHEQIEQRVAEISKMLGIEHLIHRKPRQLSGGQRQRVALGRAMARQPKVFLFDEPLSNLDAKLRMEMRTEIKRLQRSLETTSIYVTHDQIEAMTLADRIVILDSGVVQQIGKPEELYNAPVNIFVAAFFGSPPMNLIEGIARATDEGFVFTLGDALSLPLPQVLRDQLSDGQKLILGLRPEHIYITGDKLQSGLRIQVKIELVEPQGADTVFVIRLDGKEILGRVEASEAPQESAVTDIALDVSKLHLFDAESGQRIDRVQ